MAPMAASFVAHPPRSAGWPIRLFARARAACSRRALCRMAGIRTVSLEGHVRALRPVPISVAREMVPALIRCARSFALWQIDEALYDDFVTTLSLGLGLPRASVERLTVPLWDLAPVVEMIAQVHGLPTVEAGRADLGKLQAAMLSIGTASSPGSSPTPAGPGSTSSNA